MRRTLVVSVILVSAAGLAGCSKTVAQADVEEQINTQLTEQVGQEPDDVTCPGDLDAEVGATMTCTLTAGGDELDVAVEVTEVDGSDVNYAFEVLDPAS